MIHFLFFYNSEFCKLTEDCTALMTDMLVIDAFNLLFLIGVYFFIKWLVGIVIGEDEEEYEEIEYERKKRKNNNNIIPTELWGIGKEILILAKDKIF